LPEYTIIIHSYYELSEDMLKELKDKVKFALAEDYDIVVIIKSIEKTGEEWNEYQTIHRPMEDSKMGYWRYGTSSRISIFSNGKID